MDALVGEKTALVLYSSRDRKPMEGMKNLVLMKNLSTILNRLKFLESFA